MRENSNFYYAENLTRVSCVLIGYFMTSCDLNLRAFKRVCDGAEVEVMNDFSLKNGRYKGMQVSLKEKNLTVFKT